jgi:phage terminase large subunit-like protein
VLHATGLYPSWWSGRRFECPTVGWACGDTGKTLRDVLQEKFLGPIGSNDLFGSGLIPKDRIVRTTARMGTADAVESIYVRHVSGGISSIQLKAYEQGRESYQGASCHWIHLDEEPPEDIYVECLMRLTTTHGIIYMTATPLLGLTKIMLAFLPHMAPATDKILEETVKKTYN